MPIITYAINYDYIRTELCENVDEPELKCNGKCHLKKELAKEVQEKNPVSESKKVSYAEFNYLFCTAFKAFTFDRPLLDVAYKNMIPYSNLYQREGVYSIFHPPSIFS